MRHPVSTPGCFEQELSPPGRPKGESLSAQREGHLMFPPGRPKGDSFECQREGSPVSPRAAPTLSQASEETWR
jgi:hypothetical protein